MGAFYDSIPNEDIRNWILSQKAFWVASAPLSAEGHVNTSPKGRQPLNLVGDNACWYTDMTGSGNETLSHLYEQGNGRITIMFSAFEGPARIVRLFGKGRVFERGSREFRDLLPDGDERILPGTRCIIWIDFYKVSTSCGFSVPYFSYEGERLQLDEYYTKLQDSSPTDEETGLASKLIEYWSKKNSFSIDSMPGLKLGRDLSIALVPAFDTYASKTKTSPAKAAQLSNPSRADMLFMLAMMFVSGLLARPLLQSIATRAGLLG